MSRRSQSHLAIAGGPGLGSASLRDPRVGPPWTPTLRSADPGHPTRQWLQRPASSPNGGRRQLSPRERGPWMRLYLVRSGRTAGQFSGPEGRIAAATHTDPGRPHARQPLVPDRFRGPGVVCDRLTRRVAGRKRSRTSRSGGASPCQAPPLWKTIVDYAAGSRQQAAVDSTTPNLYNYPFA